MRQFLPRFLRDNPAFLQSVLLVVLLEATLAALLYTKLINFDPQVGLAVFGGLPVLLISLVQIYTSSVVQRANLVKDLAAKLHTDRELAETFHILVYGYDDKTYEKYRNADTAQREVMNTGRSVGLRMYDTEQEALSKTEEERRLDCLLGYVDIIAYHYCKGLIRMHDIAGTLGFHLAIIHSRQAITDYRRSIPGAWGKKYGNVYGHNSVPLRFLDRMLEDYVLFCKRTDQP